MAMQLGHVHIKTREDPQKVAKFYIDNFGATVKRETPGRGCQLDLHGVQLNVTTINADQNHEQHVGIEHIAIETDDYPGALANLKKNGAHLLEERFSNGRHVRRRGCRTRRRADGADREGLRTARRLTGRQAEAQGGPIRLPGELDRAIAAASSLPRWLGSCHGAGLRRRPQPVPCRVRTCAPSGVSAPRGEFLFSHRSSEVSRVASGRTRRFDGDRFEVRKPPVGWGFALVANIHSL